MSNTKTQINGGRTSLKSKEFEGFLASIKKYDKICTYAKDLETKPCGKRFKGEKSQRYCADCRETIEDRQSHRGCLRHLKYSINGDNVLFERYNKELGCL